MKKAARMVLALALVPWLAILPVGAAEGPANSASPAGTGVALDQDPQATSVSTADGSVSGGQTAITKRQEKPDQAVRRAGNGTSVEVQQMVKDFREQQKARLDEYRKLAAQARNASAEKREQLREQLRRMIEEQKAERERLREQIQERVQELTSSLPSRREVIEAAKEKARQKQDRSKSE